MMMRISYDLFVGIILSISSIVFVLMLIAINHRKPKLLKDKIVGAK